MRRGERQAIEAEFVAKLTPLAEYLQLLWCGRFHSVQFRILRIDIFNHLTFHSFHTLSLSRLSLLKAIKAQLQNSELPKVLEARYFIASLSLDISIGTRPLLSVTWNSLSLDSVWKFFLIKLVKQSFTKTGVERICWSNIAIIKHRFDRGVQVLSSLENSNLFADLFCHFQIFDAYSFATNFLLL